MCGRNTILVNYYRDRAIFNVDLFHFKTYLFKVIVKLVQVGENSYLFRTEIIEN